MGYTTSIKKQIKNIIKTLSVECDTILKEESVIKGKENGRIRKII